MGIGLILFHHSIKLQQFVQDVYTAYLGKNMLSTEVCPEGKRVLKRDLQLPLQGGELTRRILCQTVGTKQSAGQVLQCLWLLCLVLKLVLPTSQALKLSP